MEKKEKYYLIVASRSLTVELEKAVTETEELFDIFGAKCGEQPKVIKAARIVVIDNSICDYKQQLAYDGQALVQYYAEAKAKKHLCLPAHQQEFTLQEAKIVFDALMKFKKDTNIDFAMFKIVDINHRHFIGLKSGKEKATVKED